MNLKHRFLSYSGSVCGGDSIVSNDDAAATGPKKRGGWFFKVGGGPQLFAGTFIIILEKVAVFDQSTTFG